MRKTIEIKSKGSFGKTFEFFHRKLTHAMWEKLYHYGELGVEALRNATPVDTGKTRDSWTYEVEVDKNQATIIWKNTNIVDEWANVAILLQYGHATRTGGYVQGRDYINPALKPVYDKITEELWGDLKS